MATAALAFRDEKQRPVKVLYIEDDLRAAAEMCELGWQEGDTVVVETDGLSGLRRAVMEAFDVIIMDPMLGDADGISLVGGFVRFGFLLQSLEPSFGKRHVRAFS